MQTKCFEQIWELLNSASPDLRLVVLVDGEANLDAKWKGRERSIREFICDTETSETELISFLDDCNDSGVLAQIHVTDTLDGAKLSLLKRLGKKQGYLKRDGSFVSLADAFGLVLTISSDQIDSMPGANSLLESFVVLQNSTGEHYTGVES